MEADLWTGELVRLTAEDPETMAKSFNRWASDSEYLRLLDSGPPRRHSVKAAKEWVEKFQEEHEHDVFMFGIRTLSDDRLIGDIGLDGVRWAHGDSFVGISLGEREYWGKGYGTDAMRIILRYAFTELNLHRVSLTVFEYNPRAIRSYEKAGFTVEGRARKYMLREGRRWDVIFMGILKEEWQRQNGSG